MSFNIVPIFIALVLVGRSFFGNITLGEDAGITTPAVSTQIEERITKVENNFKLENPISLVGKVRAGGEYEQARAYAVLDFESGRIIDEKNLQERLPIASLTKLMTAVVALDLADPNELFVISENAQSTQPTKIGVVAGQKMTLEELLSATLLTSANDAAEAIRDGVNQKYGAEVFIQAMNKKAEFLGFTNTSFANSTGFDHPNNYSTVADLAILTHYALTNYSFIANTVEKPYAFLPADRNHKQFDLYNWNGLLGVYPGALGVKIGNTGEAKTTTIALSAREGKKILVVLLGAPGVLERDLWAAQLLDQGYMATNNLEPVGVTREQLKQKYNSWEFWN